MIAQEHLDFVQFDEFSLKWRFVELKEFKLPQSHQEQIRPLCDESAKLVADVGNQVLLNEGVPFARTQFRNSETLDIRDWLLRSGTEKQVRKWLYEKGPAFRSPVYLSWDDQVAAMVPWKIFIRYWPHFYYTTSDDLLVFDESLQWAFYFSSREEIFFGGCD